MSDVTTRLASVQTGLARLREQVPAIEWQQATLLKLVAELAAIVAELRPSSDAPQAGDGTVTRRKIQSREDQIKGMAYQACAAVHKIGRAHV